MTWKTALLAFLCGATLLTADTPQQQNDFRATLNLGLKVLADASLPCTEAQRGDLIKKRLATASNLAELEDVERQELEEAPAVFGLSPLSPQFPGKDRDKNYLQEKAARFVDWRRHEETLARFGLKASASVEMARIELALQTAQGKPTRGFERTMEFYKRVAEERFRLGSALLTAERELVAWRKTAALAQSTFPKPVAKSVEAALANWRRGYNQGNYNAASTQEAAANALLGKLKATDGKTPVVRPGASFLSAGTFAYGGSWQTLLNTMAREAKLYRAAFNGGSASSFLPYDNDKLAWTVSFGPADASFKGYEFKDGSWTYAHRVNRFSNLDSGKEFLQDCYWSMLAPGVLFDTHAPAAAFSDDTLGNPVPPDKLLGVFDGQPRLLKNGEPIDPKTMTEGWLLLLWENPAPQLPVLVFFEKRPDKLEWSDKGLLASRAPEVGKHAAATLYGAAPMPSRWSASWQGVPAEVVDQCRAVAAKLAFFPLSVDEFYAVEDKTIKVWNRLDKFVELKDDWNTPKSPYLPAPPLYALGLEGGAPVKFDQELSPSLMTTKFGFYRTATGKELSYTIPRFRMWQRVVLKPTGEDKLLELYNRYLPNVSERKRTSAELLGFTDGWCLMDAASREFLDSHKTAREAEDFLRGEAFAGHLHSLLLATDLYIDPLTGTSAWLRGWRGFRHDVPMRGDPTAFNMYGLAEAYAQAKTFGRWDMLERNWDYMKRLYSFSGFRQGWAVPGQDCLSTGWIFCGDMLGDGLRANSLMAAMAEVVGDQENADLATYLYARTMLSTGCLVNPNIVNYCAHVKNTPAALSPDAALGQLGCDDQGFLTGPWKPYTKSAWNAPFQTAGCTIYDYPFYGSLLDRFPETTRLWIDRFMKDIPEWAEPAYRWAQGTHPGERDTNAWQVLKYLAFSGSDKAELRKLFERCFTPPPEGYGKDWRQCVSWLGFGNAMPHLIAQNDPLWLGEWDKARLLSGDFDRQSRAATVKLESPRAGTLSMVSLAKPIRIAVNGAEPPFDYDAQDGSLRVTFPAGKTEIRVELPEAPDAYLKYPDYAAHPLGQALALTKAPPPGKIEVKTLSGDLSVANCESVDLAPACDMGFADATAGDKQGGTDDNGDTWLFPKGKVVVRGVPFTFVDPDKNGGKSCVALKGMARDYFPTEATKIKVGKRFQRLFFLQGMGYGQADGSPALTYRLNFEGGQTRTVAVRAGQDIGEWKVPPGKKNLPDLPNARGGAAYPPGKPGQWGEGAGGYVLEWKSDVSAAGTTNQTSSQQGLAVLESIDIISAGKAVPLVFAITGEL